MSQRRKLLKALSIASVPAATWTPPLVKSVVLPAHAQTSLDQAPEGFSINCAVEDTDGACRAGEIEFRVFGTVSGGDLTGAILTITYSNEPEEGQGIRFFSTTTVVQPGNTFDETVQASPPAGNLWGDPTGLVAVRFQDVSTFGFVECTRSHTCGPTL